MNDTRGVSWDGFSQHPSDLARLHMKNCPPAAGVSKHLQTPIMLSNLLLTCFVNLKYL